MIAHYAHLLAERARPATFRPRWSRPAPAAAPAVAPRTPASEQRQWKHRHEVLPLPLGAPR